MGGRNAVVHGDKHHCEHKHDGRLFPPETPHGDGKVIAELGEKCLINGDIPAVVGDWCTCDGVPGLEPRASIRGASLHTFINGQPMARDGDKTDKGIVTGTGKTQVGDTPDRLSPEALDWLTKHLRAQKNIPWAYAVDGCYARAEAMTDKMRNYFGIKDENVQKIFAFGILEPDVAFKDDPEMPWDGTWRYHVAPIVEGADDKQYVIDPGLSPEKALTIDEWLAEMGGDSETIYTKIAPVYYYGYNSKEEIYIFPSDKDPKNAAYNDKKDSTGTKFRSKVSKGYKTSLNDPPSDRGISGTPVYRPKHLP